MNTNKFFGLYNCTFCKKNIKLADSIVKCKCGNIFCSKHRQPHNHNCIYDYKKDRVILQKIQGDKIIKI